MIGFTWTVAGTDLLLSKLATVSNRNLQSGQSWQAFCPRGRQDQSWGTPVNLCQGVIDISCGWFRSRWSDTGQVHHYRHQCEEASFWKLPIQPIEKDTSGPSEQLQMLSDALHHRQGELISPHWLGREPRKISLLMYKSSDVTLSRKSQKVYFCPSCSQASSCCSQEEYVLSVQGKKDVVYTGKWSAACKIKAKHPHSTYFKQELRMVVLQVFVFIEFPVFSLGKTDNRSCLK